MDYKEKYEQALERARQFSEKPYLEDSAGIVEYIFPELKESEDERIKKEITELVMQPTWKTEKEFHRRKELCAWLEKQGEQKPAWSEDDERISSNINLYISKAGDYPHFGKENIKEAKNWMNALKDRVQPQPKQEWSEEDETVLDNLIYALANDRIGNDRDEYVTWLKSLKDRVGCEVNCITTKEWSEKDGSRIDNLCHFLEEYGNQYYGHLTLQGTISWLKSLKPQNTWKPSEYELKVLKLAAEKDGACLMGLYQQLKKLRGE